MNFYVVTCIIEKSNTVGYRSVHVSATSESNAKGKALEVLEQAEPNGSFSKFTAILINRYSFVELGIDPIEYFSKNEKE